MYRTIDTSLWTDPTVKKLPPLAKLLFLYLITNGHTHVCGLYYLPGMFIAHETGIAATELDSVFDTLSGAGLVRFDPDRELIWVINMFRYQGRGEKNQRGAANHLATLHNSPLINGFLRKYSVVREFYRDNLSEGVSDRVSEFGTQNRNRNRNTPSAAEGGGSSEGNAKARETEYTPEFLALWDAAPKLARERSSRSEAFAEWKRQGCQAVAPEVMAGLDRCKRSASWLKENGQYVQALHRWLKARKWEDAPPDGQTTPAVASPGRGRDWQ